MSTFVAMMELRVRNDQAAAALKATSAEVAQLGEVASTARAPLALVGPSLAEGARDATPAVTALRSELAQVGLAAQVMASGQQRVAQTALAVRESHGLAASQVANLGYQFNDIGMMLAAGQNPLMLAIQQGSQIGQVLGPMGAGGAVRALGSAFVQLLNPVNLATMAAIAAGAALVQWLTSSAEDAGTLEDRIDSLTKAMDAYAAAVKRARAPFLEMARDYGVATAQARELLAVQQEMARVEAERASAVASRGVAEMFGASKDAVTPGDDVVTQMNRLAALGEIADTLGVDLDKAEAKVTAVAQALDDLAGAEGPKAQAAAFAALRGAIDSATGGVGSMNEETFALFENLLTAEDAALRLAAGEEAMGAAAEGAAGAAGDVAGSLEDALSVADALAGVDLAGGIAAAAGAAGRLAGGLADAANNAWDALAAMGAVAKAESDVRFRVGLADLGNDERGTQREVVADANDTVRQQWWSGFRERNRKGAGRAGGGGGSSKPAEGSLAALSAEAAEALQTVGEAEAAIQEKLRAGLMTTAEGSEAIAQANRRAAESLAGVAGALTTLGPKGAAALEEVRAKLGELAAKAGETGDTLKTSLSDSFASNFKAMLTGAKADMSDFTDFVLDQIAQMFADKFTASFMDPLLSSLSTAIGAKDGAVIGAGGVDASYAEGGVPPGISAWSNRVVDRPTLFAMGGGKTGEMGEAGPEAILPLRRAFGGGLGVLASGAGGEGVLPLRRTASGALGVVLPPARPALLDRPPVAFALGGVVDGSEGGGAAPGMAAGGRVAGGPVQLTVVNNGPPMQAKQTERMEGNSHLIELVLDQVDAHLASNARRGVGDLTGAITDTFGLGRAVR